MGRKAGAGVGGVGGSPHNFTWLASDAQFARARYVYFKDGRGVVRMRYEHEGGMYRRRARGRLIQIQMRLFVSFRA